MRQAVIHTRQKLDTSERRTCAVLDEGIGKTLLIVLVLVHVAAVLYYLWRQRRNLIAPMIHGDMTLPAETRPSADGPGRRIAALALMLAAAALAWWVGSLGTP